MSLAKSTSCINIKVGICTLHNIKVLLVQMDLLNRLLTPILMVYLFLHPDNHPLLYKHPVLLLQG